MIPMGSIGPGPSRDPNDSDSKKETVLQFFGLEMIILSTVVIIVLFLLGFSVYADKKDKSLRLQEIPKQTQSLERK